MSKGIANTLGILGIIWFLSNVICNFIKTVKYLIEIGALDDNEQETKEIKNKTSHGIKMGFVKEV